MANTRPSSITPESIREQLVSMSEESYRIFSSSLIPGAETNMLGVRLPAIRKLSDKIIKGDWKNFLRGAPCKYFEDIMLEGFVLAGCPIPPKERLELLKSYLPKIDNWSVCDSVCASLKEAKQYPSLYLPFIQDCLASKEEFTLRFGLVMLMHHFLTEENFFWILEAAAIVQHPGYYAKMGAAWLLATCCAINPEKTIARFQEGNIDPTILRKAIQKSIESYRVSPSIKEELRKLRSSLPKTSAL